MFFEWETNRRVFHLNGSEFVLGTGRINLQVLFCWYISDIKCKNETCRVSSLKHKRSVSIWWWGCRRSRVSFENEKPCTLSCTINNRWVCWLDRTNKRVWNARHCSQLVSPARCLQVVPEEEVKERDDGDPRNLEVEDLYLVSPCWCPTDYWAKTEELVLWGRLALNVAPAEPRHVFLVLVLLISESLPSSVSLWPLICTVVFLLIPQLVLVSVWMTIDFFSSFLSRFGETWTFLPSIL